MAGAYHSFLFVFIAPCKKYPAEARAHWQGRQMQMFPRNRAIGRAFPNRHIAAVSILLLVVNRISTAHGVEVAASTKPPGGLSPAETPMFILWS